jgi:hypothetical protein
MPTTAPLFALIALVVATAHLAAVDNHDTRPPGGILDDGFFTHLDLLVGLRTFGDDTEDFTGGSDIAAGLQSQTIYHDWWLGVPAGMAFANANGDRGDSRHQEYWLGLHLPVRYRRFVIQGTSGLAFLNAEYELDDGPTEDLDSLGVYTQGSVRYTFENNVTIGGTLRFSYATVGSDLVGEGVNLGGIGGSLTAGFLF